MTIIIITSKCVAASVCLLNQHCESFFSSENYKYLTCFCLSVISLCLSWLLRLLCCFALLCMIDNVFVFFFTFPPQNSVARLKVSHSPVSGGVGDWCAFGSSSLSLCYFFSCRAAFHFRRVLLIIIIRDGCLNSEWKLPDDVCHTPLLENDA